MASSSEEVKAPAVPAKKKAPPTLRLVGKELWEGRDEEDWVGGRLLKTYPTKAAARTAIFERSLSAEKRKEKGAKHAKDREAAQEAMAAAQSPADHERAAILARKAGL